MGEGNSLINLGELSKPATVLIEKISDAIGGVFRPHQIRKVASAEADAEIIKAEAAIKVERLRTEAEIEISDIQRRAISRLFIEEGQKQKNIETIIRKALPELSEEAQPQNIENDWLVNFFDKCRLISDEEMQSLWSKILAGEANGSGRFSKRTVNALNSLDKDEANLFTALCRFTCAIGDDSFQYIPLIYDYELPIYRDNQINFGKLKHLDSIGLIHFDDRSNFRLSENTQLTHISYHHSFFTIEFSASPDTQNEIRIGSVFFTSLGYQLGSICDVEPIDGFYDYVMQKFIEQNLVVFTPFPRPILNQKLWI